MARSVRRCRHCRNWQSGPAPSYLENTGHWFAFAGNSNQVWSSLDPKFRSAFYLHLCKVNGLPINSLATHDRAALAALHGIKGARLNKAEGSYAYVVSASASNYFAEMAAVSMTSLRLCQPDCRIVAVIDDQSDHSPGINTIEKIANEVIRVKSNHPDAIYRSRKLKINLRNLILGDIFYLDSDTFVLRPINDIWKYEADIAAAPDIAASGRKYSPLSIGQADFKTIGWDLTNSVYLNSGVVFLRDNPNVYKFCELWYQSWVSFSDRFSKYNDQPAFNNAITRIANSTSSLSHGPRIKVLPQTWNAQITMNPVLGRKARVVHVFSGEFDNRSDTIIHIAAKHLKRTGVIDIDSIAESINVGHLWIKLDSMRKFYAAGMINNVILNSFRNKKAISLFKNICTDL